MPPPPPPSLYVRGLKIKGKSKKGKRCVLLSRDASGFWVRRCLRESLNGVVALTVDG